MLVYNTSSDGTEYRVKSKVILTSSQSPSYPLEITYMLTISCIDFVYLNLFMIVFVFAYDRYSRFFTWLFPLILTVSSWNRYCYPHFLEVKVETKGYHIWLAKTINSKLHIVLCATHKEMLPVKLPQCFLITSVVRYIRIWGMLKCEKCTSRSQWNRVTFQKPQTSTDK